MIDRVELDYLHDQAWTVATQSAVVTPEMQTNMHALNIAILEMWQEDLQGDALERSKRTVLHLSNRIMELT